MTAAPASAGADLTVVPPPPPGDDLDDVQPKASAKSAIPPPAKTEKAKPGKATAAATPTPPVSEGWVVQVAALKTRSEADAYAARLTPKGYSAYVVAPQAGTSIYRVRVGSFKTRREAQAIADKLKKEMDVTPWVTR
jgi:cell division protein FtsN